ncbi:CRISPR-associated endonuclease Cas2 [Peptacetobacter sp.]|uniref:CRISPR-associated endonuclease Cas2 n=1 Tax=Peptacetobacter sp. TaxID=2991975 RepID=UPI002632162F|nr:CRISPR-associated endonuclease Cas2 [Peptacetobacter sp.]
MKIKFKSKNNKNNSILKIKDNFDYISYNLNKNKISKKDKGIRTLVIYDVVDDKRRRELVKYLNEFGIRVQKSAFEMLLDKKRTKELKKGLKKLYDSEDKINIYQFGKFTKIIRYGFDIEEKEDNGDIII